MQVCPWSSPMLKPGPWHDFRPCSHSPWVDGVKMISTAQQLLPCRQCPGGWGSPGFWMVSSSCWSQTWLPWEGRQESTEENFLALLGLFMTPRPWSLGSYCQFISLLQKKNINLLGSPYLPSLSPLLQETRINQDCCWN